MVSHGFVQNRVGFEVSRQIARFRVGLGCSQGFVHFGVGRWGFARFWTFPCECWVLTLECAVFVWVSIVRSETFSFLWVQGVRMETYEIV